MCDNMPLSKAYDEYTIEDIYNLTAGEWTITVWDLRNDNNDEYSFSDKVKAGIYDDLYIDFSTIQL